MLSNKSFKTYIHRVLKRVYPDTHITKSGVECMDSILRTLATQLAQDAYIFTQGTEKKTLSTREVLFATKAMFPGELSKHAISQGTKAYEQFNASMKSKKPSKTDKESKPVMRETRANLIFSVSLAEKFLRGFGKVKYNIGAGASVYLAAVLEYITAEIIELAGNICKDDKKTNITVRHIYLAITTDEELNKLVEKYNIVILGGVLPSIDPRLVNKKPTKKRSKKESSEEEEKKKHRWRPGIVALRKIRKYQKSNKLLIQRAPFERLVRNVVNMWKTHMRFTYQFMNVFQYFIEHEVTNILQTSIDLSCHANRETVQISDIDLTLKLLEIPDTVEIVDTDDMTIPTAAISKLGYRAGVKRMGDDAKNRVKRVIVSLITHYIKYIILCAEHNHRQTINTKFLLEGLLLIGVNLATLPEKRKSVKGLRSSSVSNEDSDVESVFTPTKKESDDEDDEEDVMGTSVAKNEDYNEDYSEDEMTSDIEEEDSDNFSDED